MEQQANVNTYPPQQYVQQNQSQSAGYAYPPLLVRPLPLVEPITYSLNNLAHYQQPQMFQQGGEYASQQSQVYPPTSNIPLTNRSFANLQALQSPNNIFAFPAMLNFPSLSPMIVQQEEVQREVLSNDVDGEVVREQQYTGEMVYEGISSQQLQNQQGNIFGNGSFSADAFITKCMYMSSPEPVIPVRAPVAAPVPLTKTASVESVLDEPLREREVEEVPLSLREDSFDLKDDSVDIGSAQDLKEPEIEEAEFYEPLESAVAVEDVHVFVPTGEKVVVERAGEDVLVSVPIPVDEVVIDKETNHVSDNVMVETVVADLIAKASSVHEAHLAKQESARVEALREVKEEARKVAEPESAKLVLAEKVRPTVTVPEVAQRTPINSSAPAVVAKVTPRVVEKKRGFCFCGGRDEPSTP